MTSTSDSATEAVRPSQALGKGVFWHRSFIGMLLTQFLGVFNDNLFKQIVLFVCVAAGSDSAQGTATIAFSIPFILLSGFCGFLADRFSKQRIVILSKVLEIVVMLMGMAAFASGNLKFLFLVLFLMGAQSAFFGPSKYGIFPELFHDDDLPKVNGVIQMTMFIAIILGFALSGVVKEWAGDEHLYRASYVCIAIAIVGTLTSLILPRTPVAHPGLEFVPSNFFVNSETRREILGDRKLLLALLATSAFWSAGGLVYPPAINDLGLLQLNLSESQTGFLAASTGLGIAVGCIVGMLLSHDKFNGKLVQLGSFGMLLGLIAVGLPGGANGANVIGVSGSAIALIWIGLCAGIFNVPLAAYIQAKAPTAHKGRVIAAMNLMNWIGIYMSGVFYKIAVPIQQANNLPPCTLFLAAGMILAPVALFYRPGSETLCSDNPLELVPAKGPI
ncbi:MAG: MFS transporter [Planctomycetaceae bacterium]|nr:MFS transporter [Planctomycetaceae bacterium]